MGIKQNIHLLIVKLLCYSALSVLSYFPNYLQSAENCTDEVCNNAIDDDEDGLIDLNDPDCTCEILEPVSLIPNPSFEDMNCCPDNISQLNCADTWVQASEPTPDYLHMCGWLGWEDFPPPVPFPEGEGIMGFRDGRLRSNGELEENYKEYVGACLTEPLEANNSYLFEFYIGFVNNTLSPSIDITFFGTSDCDNLPFGVGDNSIGCPTNSSGWIRLGSNTVDDASGNGWIKTSIEVTPQENIRAIVIGPSCSPTQSPVSTYYFFDNLILADIQSFQFEISGVDHPCTEGFILEVPAIADLEYQWYKEGIALIGETEAQLSQIYGEGNYQVSIIDGMSCKLSKIYTHSLEVFSENSTQIICGGTTYEFGDNLLSQSGSYVDTFKTVNNCDSIVFLDLQVLDVLSDTLSVKIFEGESYTIEDNPFTKEGDHLVRLTSAQGCDSLLLLQLEYYHVYIPNAFSPNDDGHNDVFSILGDDQLIESRHLTIFNRWGALIYEGTQWNGKHNGLYVNPGVFTFIAQVRMNDGIERQFSGSVTVLK